MRRNILVVCVAGALLFGPTVGADTGVDEVLARTADYVARFQLAFSRVIGTERYTQMQRDMNRRARTRQLVSEVFFFGTTDDGGAMTVRSVQSVDGRLVRDRARRIDEALALSPNDRTAKLKALADASARYNLGTLQRNFNEPTLALMFASAAYQGRFTFGLDGSENGSGEELTRLTFSETVRPTVIRDGRSGADIPASGRLWVAPDGSVRRTELHLDKADTLATIRVSYRSDRALQMTVPATMDEDYRYRDKDTTQFLFISGHATYVGYRRFETSVRILPP